MEVTTSVVDINLLSRTYIWCDEPIPYTLSNKSTILLNPIKLINAEQFLDGISILNIDKNSYPDIKIIQMSYLQFVCSVLLTDKKLGNIYMKMLSNIIILCLDLKNSYIKWEDENTPYICDREKDIKISPKDFDNIREIILNQNIIHYNNEYINPRLKQAMDETDKLKNRGISTPSLERKIAIITAHCGLSKTEQLKMTYRSHEMLFEEVCGEVEFTTIRPVALFSGGSKELEHWIFKQDKNKFDGYITSVDAYTDSIGGATAIKSSDSTTLGDSYMQQFNNFKQ